MDKIKLTNHIKDIELKNTNNEPNIINLLAFSFLSKLLKLLKFT